MCVGVCLLVVTVIGLMAACPRDVYEQTVREASVKVVNPAKLEKQGKWDALRLKSAIKPATNGLARQKHASHYFGNQSGLHVPVV